MYIDVFNSGYILVLKQHKINPSVMRTYPNHHERQTLLNHDSLIKTKLLLGFLEEETEKNATKSCCLCEKRPCSHVAGLEAKIPSHMSSECKNHVCATDLVQNGP